MLVGLGACPSVWFLYHVWHHWRKLIFFFPFERMSNRDSFWVRAGDFCLAWACVVPAHAASFCDFILCVSPAVSVSTVPLVSSNPTGSYNPSPLLHDSLNPERKDLIKPFCLELSEPRSLNLCTLPGSDLYTSFHLLQEEVSLMMAELWETLIYG